jgi:magnesium-transporting ATPase (P-type)
VFRGCAEPGAGTQAFLIEHDANAVEFVGNRTECALLMLLRSWGLSYEALRNEHKASLFKVYNFSSERKMASVILRTASGLRLYNKVSSLQPALSLLCFGLPPTSNTSAISCLRMCSLYASGCL